MTQSIAHSCLVVPLLVLAVLGACVSPTRTEDSFDVSVELTRESIAPGDTTTIVVRAKNETDRVLTLAADACVLAVRIVNAGDRPVFLHYVDCVEAGGVVSVRPGDSLVRTIGFDGMATVAAGSAWTDEPLEPGTYYAEGGVSEDFASRSPRVELFVSEPGT